MSTLRATSILTGLFALVASAAAGPFEFQFRVADC